MPAKPKKPLTARQTVEAELRALHRLQASDKRIAEKAALKLAKDARAAVAKHNAAVKKMIAEMRKADSAVIAVQKRYDKAAAALAKKAALTNKGQLQRIALLESRLAAL